MSSPPKSCLKRHSIPSDSTHPHYLGSGTRTRARTARHSGPAFESNTSDSGSDRGSPTSCLSARPPPSATKAQGVPKARRKSVSFAEEHDVQFIYPFSDPLHIQARRQVVRIFRAFAEALRIEPAYPDDHNEFTPSEEFHDERRGEAEEYSASPQDGKYP
ncbi:hypothetical protein C8Q79DRAFT_1013664 [Trametes meyenii]|nr:hypothetical protein C8Q79DRAFT_1013664 [Trametes meyenii]